MKNDFFSGLLTAVVFCMAVASGLFMAVEQGPPGVFFEDLLPSMVFESFLTVLILTCVFIAIPSMVLAYHLLVEIRSMLWLRRIHTDFKIATYTLSFFIQEFWNKLVPQSHYSTSRSSFFKPF